MSHKIFVSYSRQDGRIIGMLVKLLRAGLYQSDNGGRDHRDLVFLDTEDIPPGEDWRQAIEQAIDRAQSIFLFWCTHSEGSNEVATEYRSALRKGKNVVPVLLDDTPLPDEIAAIQGVDLRPLRVHQVGMAGLGLGETRIAGQPKYRYLFERFAPVLQLDAGLMEAAFLRGVRR